MEQKPKTIEIDIMILNATLEYLATRPYKEVYQLIEAILKQTNNGK